jgi:hypothetical protein
LVYPKGHGSAVGNIGTADGLKTYAEVGADGGTTTPESALSGSPPLPVFADGDELGCEPEDGTRTAPLK